MNTTSTGHLTSATSEYYKITMLADDLTTISGLQAKNEAIYTTPTEYDMVKYISTDVGTGLIDLLGTTTGDNTKTLAEQLTYMAYQLLLTLPDFAGYTYSA